METVSKHNGTNDKTIRKYRWLHVLIPEMDECINDGRLSFTPAVEIVLNRQPLKIIATAIWKGTNFVVCLLGAV